MSHAAPHLPPDSPAPAGFAEARAHVEGTFARHLDHLHRIRDAVLTAATDGDVPLTEVALRPVRALVEPWLDGSTAAQGHGFIAAPGMVDGLERYLYWFQVGDPPRRLRLNFDPQDVNVYDYLEMDWYCLAEQHRRAVCHGPWVDYTGSDQFVLTTAVPVERGGRFLGVAGGDLLVTRLEAALVPRLRRVAVETVLVNAERQVVMSNAARWIPGDRLHVHPLDAPEEFAAVAEVVPEARWAMAAVRDARR